MNTANDLLSLALRTLSKIDSTSDIVDQIETFLESETVLETETVTISKNEYESLLEDSNFLLALNDAGVDNWSGYDYAREIFDM